MGGGRQSNDGEKNKRGLTQTKVITSGSSKTEHERI